MAVLKRVAIFVLSDQHEQSSRDKYRKTCSGAFRKLFVEHYVGEQYRHEDTKLVYRNNNACRTVLKRLVVAQPGAAGSESREGDEQQLALVQPAELIRLARHRDHQPCHHQDNRSAYRSAEVGAYAVDTYFTEYRGQRGEYCRENRVGKPLRAV